MGDDARDGIVELAFSTPREEITDPTHFRTTWLTASQATLRELGHFARYEALLPASRRAEILATVAGQWAPMEIARVHYTACDQLGLPSAELVEIGRGSAQRANKTMLSLVARLSKGAGVTPWTVLTQVHRIVERTMLGGGGIAVWRHGPKEGRLEFVGYPLAGIRYNRVTFRGIITGVTEMFCQKMYVAEIPTACTERTLGFRLSWV